MTVTTSPRPICSDPNLPPVTTVFTNPFGTVVVAADDIERAEWILNFDGVVADANGVVVEKAETVFAIDKTRTIVANPKRGSFIIDKDDILAI